MSNMARPLKSTSFLVGAAFIVILAIGLAGCERKSARISACVDNLRNIEICKKLWADNENKTTNDIPNWDDLKPYFPDRWSNSIPICPAGGKYSINRVGKLPTCSIGGPGHSLSPQDYPNH